MTLRRVKCRFFPGEQCIACGPDGDAFLDGARPEAGPTPRKPAPKLVRNDAEGVVRMAAEIVRQARP